MCTCSLSNFAFMFFRRLHSECSMVWPPTLMVRSGGSTPTLFRSTTTTWRGFGCSLRISIRGIGARERVEVSDYAYVCWTYSHYELVLFMFYLNIYMLVYTYERNLGFGCRYEIRVSEELDPFRIGRPRVLPIFRKWKSFRI